MKLLQKTMHITAILFTFCLVSSAYAEESLKDKPVEIKPVSILSNEADTLFKCASYYNHLAMQANISKFFSTPEEYAKTGERLTRNFVQITDYKLEQKYTQIANLYNNEGVKLKREQLNNNSKFFNFLSQKYALQGYDRAFQQGYIVGREQHKNEQFIFEGMDLLFAKKIAEQEFDDKYLNPTKQCTKF